MTIDVWNTATPSYQFNRLINTLRKEEEKTNSTDRYPWLDDSDERKCMADREILDKYIYLENSYLIRWAKQKVRNLIYEYKGHTQFDR